MKSVMNIQINTIPVVGALFKYARLTVYFLGASLFRLLLSGLFFVVLVMCFKHRINEESDNEYSKAT